MTFAAGQFVRVRRDYDGTRAGKDGMVMEDFGPKGVVLYFGCDRHCQRQQVICVGPELWKRDELDFETVSEGS